MKRAIVLCAMVPMAAALSDTQVQDTSGGDARTASMWRCGHTDGEDNENSKIVDAYGNGKAGIVFLREGSLNYLRNSEEYEAVSTMTDARRAQRMNVDFYQDLFCGAYISGYKNPNADGLAGVCIRNNATGSKWDSIVEADNAAAARWAYFSSINGYQKSVKAEHTPSSDDFNTLWGSGRSGDSPNNWCSEYMKEMICHISFPQWAGQYSDLGSADFDGTRNKGHLVRPVASSTCTSMMDNCNRQEPFPYSGVVDFIRTVVGNDDDADESRDNSFYCKAWNLGYDIAQVCCIVQYFSEPKLGLLIFLHATAVCRSRKRCSLEKSWLCFL